VCNAFCISLSSPDGAATSRADRNVEHAISLCRKPSIVSEDHRQLAVNFEGPPLDLGVGDSIKDSSRQTD
jgi:hypothetical protein